MRISESEEYGDDDYGDTSSHAAAHASAPEAARSDKDIDMEEDRPVTYQGDDDDFESTTQAHEPDLPARPNLLANGMSIGPN